MPEHQKPPNISDEHEQHWPYLRAVSAPIWIIWSICLFAGFAGFVAHYYVYEHSAKIKFFSDALFSFSALAVIITQAVIYSQQRDAMRQQVEIARIAERAYIGIKEVHVYDLRVGEIPFIEVIFLNGGRTPAWNVHPPATVRVWTVPPEKLPEYPAEQGAFMPPGIPRSVKYHFIEPFTQEDVTNVMTGIEKLFLFGKVWFEDAWGERRDFEFRLVFRPTDAKFEEYKPNQNW